MRLNRQHAPATPHTLLAEGGFTGFHGLGDRMSASGSVATQSAGADHGTTLRWTLRITVACACIALIVAEALSIVNARDKALRDARTNVLNLATALAQHANDSLEIADAALAGVVSRIEDGGMSLADSAALHRFLRQEGQRIERVHAFFVYGADGGWLNSSLEGPPRSHNNSDRDYFRWHRAHPGNDSYVGIPVISRSDGSQVMTLSRRIDVDEAFAGVALATMRTEFFARYYGSFDLGARGIIRMTRRDGVVLARQPDAGTPGRSLWQSPAFQRTLAIGKGTDTARSTIDQVERITGFAPVGAYGVQVLVGRDIDVVLADWRESSWHRAVMTLLGVMLILAIGVWLDRQLRSTLRDRARLARDVLVDPLTSLANRRHFEQRLQQGLARARRDGTSLSLLLIDVDHFKAYNDHYGHVQGDAGLRDVAAAIAGALRRPDDLAARYGGEEFVVVLPGSDRAGAQAVAEQVRQAVERLRLPHAGSPLHGCVTVSVGVASVDAGQAHDDPDVLVRAADIALYHAKAGGRNQVSG